MVATKDIAKYNILKNNSEIQMLLMKLEEMDALRLKAEQELTDKIVSAQKSCAHAFVQNRGKYDSYEGCKVLLSKTCSECGLTENKPEGVSWKICQNCWGEMKFQGTQPGQGERTQHYECTLCKHHHSHT